MQVETTLRYRCAALVSGQTSRGNPIPTDSRRTTRINTSLKPESLTTDVSLASYHVWRQKFQDFYISNGMDQFSIREQRAQLHGCMDVAMVQTISQYLDVFDDEPVVDVLDKIQVHIAKSINIVRRRHDFNTLMQKPGESFCDLYVRLKLVGGLAEVEDISYEEILASRLIVAVSDQELQRELLCMDNPSLAQVKAKCESWEAGGANLAALQGKVSARVARTSKYRQEKQRSRSKSQSRMSEQSGSCGRCCFKDHVGPNCPAKNQSCRSCGKDGHFQRMCKSKAVVDPKKSSGRDVVQTTRVTISSTSVKNVRSNATPRAKIHVSDLFGNSFEAIVLPDTGATDCIVPSQLLKSHNVVVDSSKRATISAANGTRLVCDGIVTLKLRWLNHDARVQASVRFVNLLIIRTLFPSRDRKTIGKMMSELSLRAGTKS